MFDDLELDCESAEECDIMNKRIMMGVCLLRRMPGKMKQYSMYEEEDENETENEEEK